MKGSTEIIGHTCSSEGLLTSVIESQNASFPVDCVAQQSVSLVSHGSPWQYVAGKKVAKQKVSNIIRDQHCFFLLFNQIYFLLLLSPRKVPRKPAHTCAKDGELDSVIVVHLGALAQHTSASSVAQGLVSHDGSAKQKESKRETEKKNTISTSLFETNKHQNTTDNRYVVYLHSSMNPCIWHHCTPRDRLLCTWKRPPLFEHNNQLQCTDH